MKDITLVGCDSKAAGLLSLAMSLTCRHIDVKDILIFSDKEIISGARHIYQERFPSINEYNEFCFRGMQEYVTTSHMLLVQWDSMAHDDTQWTDEFLEYDYIGAPWPWYQEGKNIGNGGFSLRSSKLLEVLRDPHIQLMPGIPEAVNEDQCIGNHYRPYLESTHGIKFPSTKLAAQFSYELGDYTPSFGFHGPWNVIKFSDMATINYYIEKMDYTGWNIYKWHHLLYELTQRDLYDHIAFVGKKLPYLDIQLMDHLLAWLRNDKFTNSNPLFWHEVNF